ncbi:MAG: YcxB family protein [Oscillospiraceae bacterium]|nr:YcxB family protein [Oscillospiraceae bacterium]
MEYTFELRPLRNPAVLAQLADALEERAQLLAHPRREKGALSPKERLRRKKLRYRVYLATLTFMGAVLLAFTLAARELKTLLVGAVLTGCCALWLWQSREARPPRAASKEQLMTQAGRAERAGARVAFSEDGMRICPARGGEEQVPYGDILFAFESDDLLVLTGQSRAVALQTLELSWGDWAEFRAFLALRIDEYVDLRKQK